jgi:phage repressor protein C with HTH and peptisase S24 domain
MKTKTKESKPASGETKGIFRVRVRGDSMAPKYPAGCYVEFKLLRTREGMPDLAAAVVGKRYYVQLRDDTGTFKQLAGVTDAGLVLAATNKKCRKELFAPFDEIVRLAAAVGIYVPESE